jgi:hypothetical protein
VIDIGISYFKGFRASRDVVQQGGCCHFWQMRAVTQKPRKRKEGFAQAGIIGGARVLTMALETYTPW